jgi:c-di-GMP-binding flagellar brake protein YcgR
MKIFSSVPSPAPDRSIRRYPRSIFTAPLTLRHLGAGGVHKLRGITLDVSEGGMGALVQGNLQTGEAVEVDMHLDGQVLNAVAIVRHTSNVRCGFEFLGMTSEERAQITEIIGRQPDPSRSARWAD